MIHWIWLIPAVIFGASIGVIIMTLVMSNIDNEYENLEELQ